MTTKDIPENDTYLTTKNNRPVREAIDMTFTDKTKKERGNQVQYSFNETTNELCFEKESVGRATVFMDRNIVDLSIEGKLDWITLYTDPVGHRTFGFYAKDPSRLGFVCFTNYTLSGYEFEVKHPEFSKFSSEKVRFQYDGEGWNIYDEDTLLGKVTPEDFPHSSTKTSEMIPMIGFKIDSSTKLPHSIVVKGYRKSTDARINVSGNTERIDYVKTDWVSHETVVSADCLNNIEDEVEYVSNTVKTLDVALESHTSNNNVHITAEERSTWNSKANASDIPTLNNTVTSTSTSEAATANAVKMAYDRAEQAFQSASNGKKVIANAVTGKGVQTYASDTFETMAANISNIKTGYDVGNIIPSSKTSAYIGEEWQFTGHTGYVVSVAVDNSGNVYSSSQDKTLRKLNSNGKEIWQFTSHTSFARSVAVDNSGNVYSGLMDKTVRKINSSGVEEWQFTGHTGSVINVTVDKFGNVYSGSVDKTVRKINKNGVEEWQFTGHTGYVMSVAVDDSGNVYSSSHDKTLRKINSSGTEVWKFTGHTNWISGVAVDKFGNVYSGSHDKTVRKLNSNGSEVWKFTGHSDYVLSVTVDNSGNVYSGSVDNTVRKIDSNGTEVWKFTGHTDSINGVVIDNSGNIYSGSVDKTVRKIIEGYKIIA